MMLPACQTLDLQFEKGILYLTFTEDHLAFVINLGAARRTGLDISAIS